MKPASEIRIEANGAMDEPLRRFLTAESRDEIRAPVRR
jgi:hypothetical protein